MSIMFMVDVLCHKVHGGTRATDIREKVEKASTLAAKNRKNYGENFQTVLFFDEANTSEAIGVIKEFLCDKIAGTNGLHMIAACNPYRK